MPKITKRIVDAAAPDSDGRRRYLWDTEIRGFGLLVLPTGIKSYVFQYRTPEGRARRATIGKHGTWTPDGARDKADEWRRIVKAGGDPLAEKEGKRKAPTVSDMLDAYLKSERFNNKAESTQAIDRGRIERHLRPLIGKKHIHTLTPADIERTLVAIRTGKTAKVVKTKARGKARVTGGEGAAKMAIDLLRAIFNWGRRNGFAEANPCEHVETGSTGTRETILQDAEAYKRLFLALDAMELEKRIRAAVADAIRLIALTGARRGEIAGLRWSHVDLKAGLVTLPPKAHKAGRRTGKARVIGLPAAAQAIIARQPAGAPDDFVFAPAGGNGPLALSKVWRKVRTEAGLPEDIGLHGLRHSMASHMAMAGAQAAQIMTAMGHSQLSTAQRYVHWAQDRRQALAEDAAKVALAGMAASSKAAEGRTIIPLKEAHDHE